MRGKSAQIHHFGQIELDPLMQPSFTKIQKENVKCHHLNIFQSRPEIACKMAG